MAEIKKIVIKIKDKESELTLEEAEELWEVLDDLFSKEQRIITVPYYPYTVPHIWKWWEPTWISTETYSITCTSSNT